MSSAFIFLSARNMHNAEYFTLCFYFKKFFQKGIDNFNFMIYNENKCSVWHEKSSKKRR